MRILRDARTIILTRHAADPPDPSVPVRLQTQAPSVSDYSAGRRGGDEALSILKQQLEASRTELARAQQQAEVRLIFAARFRDAIVTSDQHCSCTIFFTAGNCVFQPCNIQVPLNCSLMCPTMITITAMVLLIGIGGRQKGRGAGASRQPKGGCPEGRSTACRGAPGRGAAGRKAEGRKGEGRAAEGRAAEGSSAGRGGGGSAEGRV